MPNLNRALKLIREFHNLTQSKCAEKLGVSQVVISHIESGKPVSFSMISRYGEFFEIPEWQILFFSENMQIPNPKSEALRQFIGNKLLKIFEYISKKAEISEIQKDY